MTKLVVGLFSLILFLGHANAQPYNYAEALQKSILFYDMQRSGAVEANKRVDWRGNSHMNDGSHVAASVAPGGWDLSGGWYDGSAHVKWNNSMSFAMSTLAWGAAVYKAGYVNTGQMPFLLDQLRWCGDYFVKCVKFTDINTIATYRIAIDVGTDTILAGNPLNPPGFAETNFEAPSEVIHRFFPKRPTYYANNLRPQAGSVAAMAAALASAAYVLRDNGDSVKSNQYLAVADKLYLFAKTYRNNNLAKQSEYRMNNTQTIKVTGPALPRDGDPLAWAGIWLHKAHNKKDPNFGDSYLADARVEAGTFGNEAWNSTYSISSYKLGIFILLSQYYDATQTLYADNAGRAFLNAQIEENLSVCADSMPTVRVDNTTRGWTPGGLVKIQELGSRDRSREGFGKQQYGSLRHANNQAFCAFVYADQIANADPLSGYVNVALSATYKKFAKRQLDYTLGSNPQNRSYVHGYQPAGKSVLTTAPHPTARGTWAGREHDIVGRPEYQPNYRHIPYGAVAGGPNWNDRYFALDGLPPQPDTMPRNMTTAHQMKIGIDHNAGFSGSLARMAALSPNGAVLPNFPSPSPRNGAIDEEYFVEAEQTTTANSIQIRARMNNRSRWPAKVRNNMSFRYFFVPEAGAVITPSIVAFSGTAPLEAALNPQISAPVNYANDKYYVTITFPGDTLFPGYAPPRARSYYREVIFKLTSSTTWDNSNDFSFDGFAPIANVVPPNIAPKIAVFDNGLLIGGLAEPSLGVSARNNKAKFSLSPNPAKNDLNLSWDLMDNQSKQIDIYDMLGKNVSSIKNVTSNKINIQLSGLKPGMYVVDLRRSNNQESLGKVKFIKQ